MTQTITVQYFAQLREQTGLTQETWETAAETPDALYAEIQAKHGTTPSLSQLKVAINQKFSSLETPLKSGDHVVFIPPVAGG